MATILAVDGDSQVRLIIRKLLEADGHEVLPASDGLQALQVLRREDVHLILIETHIPMVEDVEVIVHMRRIESEIPIVLMSGVGWGPRAALLEGSKSLAPIEGVEKPFDARTLQATVRRLLDERRDSEVG